MMQSDEAAEARQAAILSQPIRIAPLPQDELGPQVRAHVARIGATLGYEAPEELTTHFAVMARHPGLFRCQLETGIMFFTECALAPRMRELVILRTAWHAGAPYEWGEHVDIGRGLGMTPEETDRVRKGPQAPGWSKHEAALLSAVDELFADTMISDATWAILAESLSEAQLIELPCLVGQYLGVAMLQNSLRMPMARESKGFAER